MTQSTPYTPGVVARAVPGREQQLGVYEERALLISELQQFIGRIRVEVAPRGMGKTSLLRQAQKKMENNRIATIWVTAGEASGLLTSIYSELRKLSTGWRGAAKTALVDSLESVAASVGVPGIAKVEAKWAMKSEAAPSGARQFEAVIRSAVAAAHQHKKTGLAIFVDEVQSSDAESLRTISYTWQHLQAEGQDVAAGLFAAGLPDSADEITSKVTFSERFEFRQLHLMEREAVKLALALPAKKLGVIWTNDALEFAVDHAEGYPHKVQLIGEGSWAAAGRPDPGSQIVYAHVVAGLVDATEQMDNLYRARWRNSTAREQSLLLAMAELATDSILRADVAGSLGVTSNELSVVRGRLIQKGFIEAAGRGKLAFTVPGFGDWLRNRLDE